MRQREPWGRIGSGSAESIAGLLIFIPAAAVCGALLATGAIPSHLTALGVVVQNDGGTLFILALIVFFAILLVLFLHREDLPIIGT